MDHLSLNVKLNVLKQFTKIMISRFWHHLNGRVLHESWDGSIYSPTGKLGKSALA